MCFFILSSPDFKFIKGDIADRKFIFELFEKEKPDMVVNFAAESHVDRSIENPGVFLNTNIMGTQVMMDACRKYGIKRYHQVSTDEVYGDLPLDSPDLFFTEETPTPESTLTARERQVGLSRINSVSKLAPFEAALYEFGIAYICLSLCRLLIFYDINI